MEQSEKVSSDNVTWFVPPFNLFCATNVGEQFRELIKKHFSRNDMLGKLFNKNRLKISYSCMPNLKAKIGSHNKKLIFNFLQKKFVKKDCNCQKSRECPLDGKCVVESVVYKAEVLKPGENEGEGHFYVGLAGGPFKTRLANHLQSFKNINKKKQSKLAEFVWRMKEEGCLDFKVNWSILAKESGYNRKSKRCQLCTREKLEILRCIRAKPSKTINKRDEIFRKCLHRKKHFLGQVLEDSCYKENNIQLNIEEEISQVISGLNQRSSVQGKSWRKDEMEVT